MRAWGLRLARQPVVLAIVAAALLFLVAPAHCEPGGPGAAAAAAAGKDGSDAGALPPPITCPGISGGVCTLPCQRATCEALATFFRLSYNDSMPWHNGTSWLVTRTLPCTRIVPAPAGPRPPAYCGWSGITCCAPGDAATRGCGPVHSVAEINITADSLNASYSNPLLMDSLERLHACGMTVLNLESNDMSGELNARWGRFTNLTVLNLANSWLSGTIPPQLANLRKLRQLELGTNFLRGTIGSWIGDLDKLEILNLGANGGVNEGEGNEEAAGFIGRIPNSITKLTKLVELDLQINSLTGTIPPNLCGPGSELRVLNVRGNRLEGPAAPVTKCTQLASLDIGFNSLTGSLPANKDWNNLVSLMIGHNQFHGEVPEELYQMPLVTYLDISSNNLVGELNDGISLLIYLTDLDASGNNLTGAVGSGLFFLPQIARLNLANNNFTGTLDPNLGLAFNLRELVLANNTGLVGRFPDEAAGLAHLHRVGLVGTDMSCEPQDVAEAAAKLRLEGKEPPPYKCPEKDLLPCFLEFEKFAVPLSDSSKMACRPIKRRPYEEVVTSCPPAALVSVPDKSEEVLAAQWDLPPAYYQYQGCVCLEGWVAVWTRGATRLQCVPDNRSELPAWTWVLVALGAALVLLAASLLLLSSRLLLFQRRWLRETELKRKRRLGVPKGGDVVYIVVTDIEGYSLLMKASPSLTTKALSMHNAVLRKAANDNAGHVFDQEGDSWGVAFHEAQDAVAFCLQAQQALQKVDWPLGLMSHGSETDYPAADGLASTASMESGLAPPRSRLRQLLGVGSLGLMSLRSTTSAGTGSWIGPMPSIGPNATGTGGGLAPLGPLPSFTSSEERADGAAAANASATGLARAGSGGGGGGAPGGGEGDDEGAAALSGANSLSGSLPPVLGPSGNSGCSSHLEQLTLGPATAQPSVGRSSASGWGAPPGRAPPGAPGPPPRGGGGSRRKFLKLLMRQGDAAAHEVFYGLRVRMGVAGGRLARGVELSRSAVFDLAKVISDMANGGQVLLDAATFDQVKDHAGLAAVDQHGYNDRMLADRAGGGAAALCGSCRDLLPCGGQGGEYGPQGPAGAEAGGVVFLDMGEYEVPGINVAAAHGSRQQQQGELSGSDKEGDRDGREPAPGGRRDADGRQAKPEGGRRGGGGGGGGAAGKDGGFVALEVDGGAAANGAARGAARDQQQQQQKQKQDGQPAAAANGAGGGSGGRPDRLRVYSVLPGCLADRAKVWGSSLALKEGWRQTDRGFFDAPGAAAAACLSPRDVALAPEAMPPVTMVFAGVEGAKWLVRWRHAGEVREMARLLRLVLAAALRAVPGGYLCREQEGGLRYMLAFRSAEGALAWCLLVQEALMYAPWPPALLELPEFGESHTPDGGTLLFRGPRLKMGVAEGRPRSLVADHAGRADYFGASVNAAARYMDAAAHGGQVAADIELVKAVFRDWRIGVEAPSEASSAAPSRQASGSLPPWPPPGRSPLAGADRQGGLFSQRAPFSGPLPSVRGASAPGGGPAAPRAAPSPSAPITPLQWPAGAERRWPSATGGVGDDGGAGALIQSVDDDAASSQPPTPTLSPPPADEPPAATPAPAPAPAPAARPWGAGAPPPSPAHPRWWPGHPSRLGGGGGGARGASLEGDDDDVLGIPGPSRTLSGTELISRARYSRFGAHGAHGAFLPPFAYGYGPQALARLGYQRRSSIGEMESSPRPRPAPPTTFEDEAAKLPRHAVAVRALHLGTFVFKGSDAVEMAAVTTAALAARQIFLPHEEAKGKGRRISDRSGVADAAAPSLPDILPGLRDAFIEAAGSSAGVSAPAGADGGAGGRGGGTGGYAAWLSQELARRRLFEGDGLASPQPSVRMHSFTVQRYPSGSGR